MKLRFLGGLVALALLSLNAAASGIHDFGITRTSDSKSEVFRAQLKYGDIDPGFEIARVIMSQRLRLADTKSVGVSPWDSVNFPAQVQEEVSITATWEQLQQIANAIGRGDAVGATVAIAAVVVGGVSDVAKGAGKILEGAGAEAAKAAEATARAAQAAAAEAERVTRETAQNVAREAERAAQNAAREAERAAQNAAREAERAAQQAARAVQDAPRAVESFLKKPFG